MQGKGRRAVRDFLLPFSRMSETGEPRHGGAGRPRRSLAGDLPCVRCGYNLRGLSVVTVCPECATPVRATILAAVDPYANVLRPIPLRRLTAIGLIVWSLGACGAAALTWAIRARDTLEALGQGGALRFDTHWMITLALSLIAASGLGALVLIRPHAGISRRQVLAAAAGCAAYVPLMWVFWRIHAVVDAASPGPYYHTEFADPERSRLRLIAAGLCLLILLGLRPNARLLAARSLLLREGRVDRQTMLAMSAVLVIGALGDVLHLIGMGLGGPGDAGLYLMTAGTVIIAVSFMLLTLGLAGMVIDVWRIWPVVLEPAPGFRQLLGEAEGRPKGEGRRERGDESALTSPPSPFPSPPSG